MAQPRSTTRAIFHFTYNTVYFILCLVLAALVLVLPGDVIRQALSSTLQYSSIVIIAAAYLLTALVVTFVYSLRIYVTRQVLGSIPKRWIPIGKGHAPKVVREMVMRDLGKSAAIAWEARPKVRQYRVSDSYDGLGIVEDEDPENVQYNGRESGQGPSPSAKQPKSGSSQVAEKEMGIALPPTWPVWGDIEHPGWGSPESHDLPNIQYSAVLAELPNLVEGKVMSLALSHSGSSTDSIVLEPQALALLQRTGTMSMRAYIGQLAHLGVLNSSVDFGEFLDTYECVRFSTRPTPVVMFRRLMHLFAELLRSARPLDPAVVETMLQLGDMYSEHGSRSDIDDDAPQYTDPTTPSRSLRSIDSNFGPDPVETPQSSRRRPLRPSMVARDSSTNTRGLYGTAPTTPKSRGGRSGIASRGSPRARNDSRSGSARSVDSANSFAQTRQPFSAASVSDASSSSRSLSQVSNDSVIRLASHQDRTDMPYVLRLGDTRG